MTAELERLVAVIHQMAEKRPDKVPVGFVIQRRLQPLFASRQGNPSDPLALPAGVPIYYVADWRSGTAIKIYYEQSELEAFLADKKFFQPNNPG